MIALSGALVCAVTREASRVEDVELWDAHRSDLQAAYDRFVIPGTDPPELRADLRVVLLHLSPGGDDFSPGVTNWPSAVVGAVPDFVEIVAEDQFVKSTPTEFSFREAIRGFVPMTQTYTRLFDIRQDGDDHRDSYMHRFGHPPKDFLICADKTIVNNLRVRGRWKGHGLTALGLSNGTLRNVMKPAQFGALESFDKHLHREDMLIQAIFAVRDHFGTATEVSEFSPIGRVVDQPGTVDAVEVEKHDTVYAALARMLNRVFVMLGL